MSDRQTYSEETKAAVMTALLTGQSISHAAKTYNIPRGTVSRWAAELGRPRGEVVRAEKKERIGELLVQYLESALTTLTAQMKVFSDEEWLKTQSASEAAVLHGVLADKAIRLLEALTDSEEPVSEEDEEE